VYLKKFSGGIAPGPPGDGRGEEGEGREGDKGKEEKGGREGRERKGGDTGRERRDWAPQCLTQIDAPALSYENVA
jgi:hypothetical protein